MIQDRKIEPESLMLHAGKGAMQVLLQNWPDSDQIAVMCGGGNNGGDGFVVARLAHEAGIKVRIFCLQDLNKFQGAARFALHSCQEIGMVIEPFSKGIVFHEYGVIVDALLGIGLEGVVRENYALAITAINQSGVDVLAMDVPSGINCDTGQVMGTAIRAKKTVTFIAVKQGLLTADAIDYCGQIIVNDLDIPKEVFTQVPATTRCLEYQALSQLLKSRQRNANKGLYGHVLVIGGDDGMPGAVRLAGEAALRTGAGLVTVATRKEYIGVVSSMRPELLCYGVETEQDLQPLLDKSTVIAIGPGLGQSKWSQMLWQQCVLNTDLPLVVDADALNLLAKSPVVRNNWVLTPHPGEAGRLLNKKVVEIQANRFDAIKKLQEKYGGTIVLKGAGTLIAGSDEIIYLCRQGNPGMATAGMGDSLTGIISGLLAQNLRDLQAASLGVMVHALSGDAAAAARGERGLLALDLSPFIHKWVNP